MGCAASIVNFLPLFIKTGPPRFGSLKALSTGHPPAAEKPAYQGPPTPPPALKFKGGRRLAEIDAEVFQEPEADEKVWEGRQGVAVEVETTNPPVL